MKTKERLTVEALQFYVPYFHIGDKAYNSLEKSYLLPPHEKNRLEAEAGLRDLAVERISELSRPLITREINKIISTSHKKNEPGLFETLYVAGIAGMVKGLRMFEVEKIKKSSTNYLFQWIVTYAKKELNSIEAPLGIAPSRFQRFKKISAVRKKMEFELERKVSNEEVYQYFQEGKADLKTMNGRVGSSEKPSKANLNITLDTIIEQEDFEKNLHEYQLLDPVADYSADVRLSQNDSVPFYETIFGFFIEQYNFTETAKYVLMSELGAHDVTDEQVINILNITKEEYKNVSLRWKDLLKDVNGPFYAFLKEIKGDGFEQFNVKNTLESIESHPKKINSAKYKILFNNREVRKNGLK